MKINYKIIVFFAFMSFYNLNIAQEIDYNLIAKIVLKDFSYSAIKTLEKMSENSLYEEQMMKLLNYDRLEKEKNKEAEDLDDFVKKKKKETKEKLDEIQRKINKLYRKAKDLRNTKNKHKREADMHYRNHEIAANMNNALHRNRNYAAYKKSMSLYRSYISKLNSYVDYAEKKEKEYEKDYYNLKNKINNLIRETNSTIAKYQQKRNYYREEKESLQNKLYKNYKEFINTNTINVDSNKTFTKKDNYKKKESTKELDSKLIPANQLAKWIKKGNNLQAITDAANSGKAFAQRRLARINYFVHKNDELALFWRKKAAQNGDAIAQSNLGADYEHGLKGLKKNQYEAVKLFKKSAFQGNKFGQYNLATCYEEGKGVIKNLNEAFKWYKKSANQAYILAEWKLGYMYYNGKGVKKNNRQAFHWYMKAAQKDDPISCYWIGKMYYEGIGHLQHFREGKHWLKKSANLGEKLAKEYLNKIEKPKNEKWTNKMTIREIEIKDNRTRKTLKTIEVEGEINIDLDKEVIKIFQILEGKEETLVLNFKRSEVKEEGQDYTLANEYVKGFNVRANGSEVPVKIIRYKVEERGLFLMIDTKITMIYHFNQK